MNFNFWRLTALAATLVLAGAAQADVVERSFDVRDGGTLEIETDRGRMDIRTGSSGKVTIEVRRGGARGEQLELDFVQDGDRIRVGGDFPERESGGWWRGDQARIEFKVTVPHRFNLDVATAGGSIEVDDLDGTLRAHTSGGSLDFGQINGEVNAHTSGGSIRLKGSNANVRVDTSGGSIDVGPVLGSVDARTSGGSISLSEVAGAVNASSSGGSVEATVNSQPAADCSLSTSGGGVTLFLADGIGLDINATANGGGVRSDFPIDGKTSAKRKLRGSVNGGGPRMELHTSGGSVRIRSLR